VSAKDRLRAYLEQRRELGESEMVLDSLDVDHVMRMLGALPASDSTATDAAAASASASRGPDAPPRSPEVGRDAPPREPTPERDTPRVVARDTDPAEAGRDVQVGADWSAMMKDLQKSAMPKPFNAPPTPPVAPVAHESAAPARTPLVGTLSIQGIVVPLGLRVERPSRLAHDPGAAWATLEDVDAAIRACAGCGLAATATQSVPGVGNPIADVMVVGEAPGEKEDLTGEPFVGPAGELLTKILGAIQLTREAVYICNVLKHRPPGNRNPQPDEVRACAPFLQRQIDLVQPKMILAFGTFAAQSLLGTKLGIGKLRQQIHWYQGIPLVATYHPAALLRNDAWKRPTWEDVKLARRVLDATVRS
jgi:uracil-DNA glycosylase